MTNPKLHEDMVEVIDDLLAKQKAEVLTKILGKIEVKHLKRDEDMIYPGYESVDARYRSGMNSVMAWLKQEVKKELDK